MFDGRLFALMCEGEESPDIPALGAE